MLTANRQVGEYRVTRQIGEGGLGAVFEAVHLAIPDLRAAIKVLHPALTDDPQVAARFRHEAEATQIIKHSGVVKVYDFLYLEDRTTCIVMEYLDGESLQQRMKRAAGPLPLTEVLSIHQQIADVLAVAHRQGIIHRDLKPGNVMLIPSGGGVKAKVLDFGIAKVATQDFTQLGTTDGKSVLGTLAFMAPEQFMTPSKVSGQADVYSLGIMLHWALSGKAPFYSPAQAQAARLLAYFKLHSETEPPELPAHIPAAVRQLIDQMLAKSPAERPTMQHVAGRLDALLGAPVARPPAPLPCPEPEQRRDEKTAERQPTFLVQLSAPSARPPRWRLAPLFIASGLLLGGFVTALLRLLH